MSFTLLLLTACCGASPEAAPSADQVRESIRKAIPFVEQKGQWWIDNKKCSSCHRVGSMVWSLGAARRRGFPVSDQLDPWFNWAVDDALAKDDQGKIAGAGNREGVAQLLLARSSFPNVEAAAWEPLADVVASGAEPDGAWKPGGQLPGQKRDLAETTMVSTMWLAYALADFPGQDPQVQERRQAVRQRATQVAAESKPGASTEWFVARLLLAHRLGDAATTEAMTAALRERQQEDGGWPWLAGDSSDALGAGMSLYALRHTGVAADDRAVARAQSFLLKTQRDDGAWDVRGTKAKKKDRVEETAVYWGAAWALLGLVESLPAAD